jgi:glycosyltransferase involved in cell wall biosynthesis
LAALEAMAWGVPIYSNSGGLSEVNFEGISGYLPMNTDEMAENALKILK